MAAARPMVRAGRYYAEYHGHPLRDLEVVHDHLRQVHKGGLIFLAGDSTLDNKHWFFDPARLKEEQLDSDFCADAVNGLEGVLRPPRCAKDVAYWLNHGLLAQPELDMAAINLAVEEATVGAKHSGLQRHDEFIADHITEDDVLVVSIGGNDVALAPTASTVCSMAGLAFCTPAFVLRSFHVGFGLSHFVHMFCTDVAAYVRRLVGKRRPRKILICMLYFPCEVKTDSWANTTLGLLGYNWNPGKLQTIIRTLYARMAAELPGLLTAELEGVEVVPVPMFEALDPADASDYCERVEPSASGGRKMAEQFLAAIAGAVSEQPTATPTAEGEGGAAGGAGSKPVTSSL